jgi:cobalt-zinc-cadmium efflux system protein
MAASHSFHSHAGEPRSATRILLISLCATAAFVIIEAIAGFRAHSLALLSDAGHNFTDAFALLLAAFGTYWQARPGDQVKTYGYQRAGVLAAFINALTLVVLALILFYESVERLIHPVAVHPGIMIVVSAAGIVLNTGIAWALGVHGHHHHDLNIRAAWLHMAGDAASAAGIIVGAVVIQRTGWLVVDPVLSILIGIVILWSGWGVIRDSLNILLEGLPKGLRLTEVIHEMGKVPGVINVHDLHIWSLGSESRALSCHVQIEDMPPSASDTILRRINIVLADRFAIRHTTIQFEHVRCALAEMHCTEAAQEHYHGHSH